MVSRSCRVSITVCVSRTVVGSGGDIYQGRMPRWDSSLCRETSPLVLKLFPSLVRSSRDLRIQYLFPLSTHFFSLTHSNSPTYSLPHSLVDFLALTHARTPLTSNISMAPSSKPPAPSYRCSPFPCSFFRSSLNHVCAVPLLLALSAHRRSLRSRLLSARRHSCTITVRER